jgi:hypothetical protein
VSDNLPKTLAEVIPADIVDAMIEADTRPLRKRADDLIDMAKRFVATYGEAGIQDDDVDGTAAACLAQLQRFVATKSGRVDAARIAMKEPILRASRQIDGERGSSGPYGKLIEDVEAAFRPMKRLVIAYKAAKDEKVRQAALAEATRQQAEAERLERMAESDSGTATFEDAAKAYDAADKARELATASPADRTRTHGDDFGTTSLKRKRVFAVTNASLVPRQYCSPDDKLINAAIGKAGDRIPTIPGVAIKDEDDLTVRR